MIKLLSYLIGKGVATQRKPFPKPDADVWGFPEVTLAPCEGAACNKCVTECPTEAIAITIDGDKPLLSLDRGACIGCGRCIEVCPTKTIVPNRTYEVATVTREDLILTNSGKKKVDEAKRTPRANLHIFKESVHARVVSTGCSACDAEIGASGNAVFDIERFGVHVVASPRFADALLITGPVSKGMQEPLRRCYGAMADPKLVIAIGTCAITGGVHKNGYTEANGADSIIPVDVYVPGCPPHPWSIIHGVLVAMGKAKPYIHNPETITPELVAVAGASALAPALAPDAAADASESSAAAPSEPSATAPAPTSDPSPELPETESGPEDAKSEPKSE